MQESFLAYCEMFKKITWWFQIHDWYKMEKEKKISKLEKCLKNIISLAKLGFGKNKFCELQF